MTVAELITALSRQPFQDKRVGFNYEGNFMEVRSITEHPITAKNWLPYAPSEYPDVPRIGYVVVLD